MQEHACGARSLRVPDPTLAFRRLLAAGPSGISAEIERHLRPSSLAVVLDVQEHVCGARSLRVPHPAEIER